MPNSRRQQPAAADRRLQLGGDGEAAAAEWLRARGYRILERNYRCPWGEADIIARDRCGTTVIVEVRSRHDGRRQLEALQSIGPHKQRQLRRLALGLLAERERYVDIRIDVIIVGGGAGGRLRVLAHIPNAVEDV